MSTYLRLSVARWSRPLRDAPPIGAEGALSLREGLLVALGRDGRWGIGDAAPLPGLSQETLPEVEYALERCRGLPDGDESWAHLLDELPPSLATALDAAQRDLGAAVDEPRWLCSSVLWSGPSLTVPPPRGRVVKLKVGRRPVADECAQVTTLAASGVRLRLDGNRRLDPSAALALVAAAGRALDFFEEPGPRVSAASLGVRTALDESIDEVCRAVPPHGGAEALSQAMRAFQDAAVWVVKPTIVGPRRTRQLARIAADRGVTVVLSSAYDSAVGRRGLVRCGLSLDLESVVHGLGTGGLLCPDLEAATGPVLIEEADRLRVGGPLSPSSFPELRWREIGP